MMRILLVSVLLPLAACSQGEQASAAASEPAAERPFTVETLGQYDEPWAAAFMPGTNVLFITSKRGGISWIDVQDGRKGSVTRGIPEVDYGGQGGFGDIAFSPSFQVENPGNVYLTWVESGDNGRRGAVLGRGNILCEGDDDCRLANLAILWRQDKTSGRGHYAHRILFSPDGQHLFLSSGDRQQMEPAQDLGSNLGKILRLTLDGQPAAENPWAERGGKAAQYWSIGHRNPLGLDFAPDGKLWAFEMGPRGGDELNLIERGKNYGWPLVSDGRNYSGSSIPDHATRPEFEAPKVGWTPVISAGDMEIYEGELFPDWKGDALLAGLTGRSLVHVELYGEAAREVARYDLGERLRAIVEGPDGAIYILEDDRGDSNGELLRLTPAP